MKHDPKAEGPTPDVSLNDIENALNQMNPIGDLLYWDDVLREVKSGVAGTALLIERLLKADTLTFLDSMSKGTVTAMNGLIQSTDKIERLMCESVEALKDTLEGEEEVKRIEAMASRSDEMTKQIWERLSDDISMNERRQSLMSALHGERDKRLAKALQFSGLASVHDLGEHVCVLGDSLAVRKCESVNEIAEELVILRGVVP